MFWQSFEATTYFLVGRGKDTISVWFHRSSKYISYNLRADKDIGLISIGFAMTWGITYILKMSNNKSRISMCFAVIRADHVLSKHMHKRTISV